jgi:hypothetical protein
VVPKDFDIGLGGRCLDHLMSKLTNSIKNLMEMPMDYFNGPPKCMVYYPEPLVVTYYHEEHGNLLLN